MLTTERHQAILNLLQDKQTITLQDIIDRTNASESTIRRDLSSLENDGELTRIHGGATLTERKLKEYSITEKSAKNIHEKKAIAEYVASFVNDRDCIFLDAGTTTMQLIPFLREKDVVIVTNGLTHLEALMENGIQAYLTGGMIKSKTGALIGPQAIQSLENYRFDKCFLGVNGYHTLYGYTTPDPEEAHIKYTASTLAKETYVLADHSKYNQVSFAKICNLADAALVTSNLHREEIQLLSERTDVTEVST
ncbi:DeoR/GlpR family DNA-binding transcription regulator [Virgibacillus siamensis]|uniref:DeoR/GlpR family DNA-binding transcription regulator n=1 Tax=Virgibacillus siamensis TaxID=480071 RepID=UPI0009869EFF|nr:DeoR/GlpR family DNA-binding transcription regulator [Virgibacillus siamensis]